MLNQLSQLEAAAAGLIALAGAWAIARAIARWVRLNVTPRRRAFDDAMLLINGRPAITLPEDPTVELEPPLLGALARLERIETTQARQTIIAADHAFRLDEIRRQLYPNGGHSLADAIGRLENQNGSTPT